MQRLTCLWCGTKLDFHQGAGKPRTFCSDAHKMKAHRLKVGGFVLIMNARSEKAKDKMLKDFFYEEYIRDYYLYQKESVWMLYCKNKELLKDFFGKGSDVTKRKSSVTKK